MPARMDPSPPAALSDSLLLDRPTTTAPFTAEVAALPAAQREQTKIKPLRPVKERPPVAETIDPALVKAMIAQADLLKSDRLG